LGSLNICLLLFKFIIFVFLSMSLLFYLFWFDLLSSNLTIFYFFCRVSLFFISFLESHYFLCILSRAECLKGLIRIELNLSYFSNASNNMYIKEPKSNFGSPSIKFYIKIYLLFFIIFNFDDQFFNLRSIICNLIVQLNNWYKVNRKNKWTLI